MSTPEVVDDVEWDQRFIFRLFTALSSAVPLRLAIVVLGDRKSSEDGISVGLAGRCLRPVVRGLVLEETEADFLTVLTEDEIELDREFDLEVLL